MHNKNIKREVSFLENVKIFSQFVSFCDKNYINLLVVVPPASRYYREYLDKKFKHMFYDVLNSVDGEVHLLDLFEDSFFENKDFNDADHLSDSGAEKMTEIVFEVLREIIGRI